MNTAMQLRHAVSVIAGATPASATPEYWDGDIPWATPEDVGRSREGYWLHDTRRKLTRKGYASCGATLVPEHSIVLTKRAPIGQLAVLSMEACCNQGCFLLTPRSDHDARFVYYLLTTQADLLQALGRGSTFMELATDDLKALKLTFPLLPRQRAIAAYLDRETAKIDAMIAAKERLLAILAEKRRALITHAVTRGLKPDAPRKDSGVEWLGEIPEHWELTKFSWDVFIAKGQVDPEEPQYRDMTLVAPNHIESGTGRLLASETAAEQAAISGKYLCEAGDVIYSKIRPALRKVVLANTRCLCSADMYPLRPSARINAKYLAWFLLGDRFSTWATLESQRVAMPKINREALTAIRIPVPPMGEQKAIVDAVERACQQCDGLRNVAEGSLRLLSERRSALIAAAVTGQIDVEDAA